MKFSEYLKKDQPVAWKLLTNSFSLHHLTHAYLLSGELGIPLKECAFFLAKSFLCLHPDPLADEECRICQRVEHLTYNDFLFLDGSNGTIKKDDVRNVVGDFSKTPLETRHILVYVIHLVENMTTEAINSLLKFLEEPQKDTYAILTSENEARVLPTILSRCEVIRLRKIPQDQVIEEALNDGIKLEDALLISSYLNNPSSFKNETEDEAYQNAKSLFRVAAENFKKPKAEQIFIWEKDLIPFLTGKKDARLFINFLILLVREILESKNGKKPLSYSYAKIFIGDDESGLNFTQSSLALLLKARQDLDMNIGLPLLLEHLIRSL